MLRRNPDHSLSEARFSAHKSRKPHFGPVQRAVQRLGLLALFDTVFLICLLREFVGVHDPTHIITATAMGVAGRIVFVQARARTRLSCRCWPGWTCIPHPFAPPLFPSVSSWPTLLPCPAHHGLNAPLRSQLTPARSFADRYQIRRYALASCVASLTGTKRRTNASAVSATSLRPLSIVSACPRLDLSTISVTSLRKLVVVAENLTLEDILCSNFVGVASAEGEFVGNSS
jgi:hypothetical protein